MVLDSVMFGVDANSALIATTAAPFHNNFIQDRYIRECRIMNIHGNNRIDYACLMAFYFPVYFPEKASRRSTIW